MRQIILCAIILFAQQVPVCSAGEYEQLDAVIKLKQAPKGVVFEIVGGDARSLQSAIQRIKRYKNVIKTRFPESNFVVISHGIEQFALTKDKQNEHTELHKQVQGLVKDDQIPLQVCGSFAGMMGVEENEFLAYIEVVDAAPAQIEHYKYMGYRLIEMELGANN